ncbi:MAG: efflux RND transporter periplasmic adaptor subunit [Pseudomonadota bacterium]
MNPAVNSDGDLSQRLQSLQIDHGVPSRSPFWLRPFGIVLSLCLIAGLGFALFSSPGQNNEASRRLSLTTEFIQREPPRPTPASSTHSTWTVAGYVVARRQSLVSAEVTARVTSVLVDEGTVVRKGQLIANLDATLAEAGLQIAQARADAAKQTVSVILAELAEAKRVLARTQSLAQRKIASGADLSKAQSSVAALTARLGETQARQQMAEREAERASAVVAKHAITAPFAGVVTTCMAQIGETISPMASGGSIRNGICTILDTASIEIELDVPETMISRLRIGAKAQAFLDAYPKEGLIAEVRAIAPIANREKSTIKVRLGFEHIDARLRPGMAIKVNLQDFGIGGRQ